MYEQTELQQKDGRIARLEQESAAKIQKEKTRYLELSDLNTTLREEIDALKQKMNEMKMDRVHIHDNVDELKEEHDNISIVSAESPFPIRLNMAYSPQNPVFDTESPLDTESDPEKPSMKNPKSNPDALLHDEHTFS